MILLTSRSIGLVLTVATTLAQITCPRPPSGQRLEIAKDIFVYHPPTWSVGPAKYRNAIQLVTPAITAEHPLPSAQMMIHTEKRRDHAEAVKRLAEIAAGYETPPKFLNIGGWAALERRMLVPLARVEADTPTNETRGAKGPEVSWRITTAIAAGDLLIRLETVLAPSANPHLVEEAATIGHTAVFPNKDKPEELEEELRKLDQARPFLRPPAPKPGGNPPTAVLPAGGARGVPLGHGNPLAPVPEDQALGPGSEIEIAASIDGKSVVVATNGGFFSSNNFGATFTGSKPIPKTFPRNSDPSVAFGASGKFYFAYVGYPNGTPAAGGVKGCSTAVSVSSDGGQSFSFASHAVVCPLTGAMCLPDQEHIAADRFNLAPGGDQVYSVWRNFTPASVVGITVGGPSTCAGIGGGYETPLIVCSVNSAGGWNPVAAIGSGDRARVTVGSDGFVYVVLRDGSNVMLYKFSSCSTGLSPVPGFPVTVATINDPPCPVPGLNRCRTQSLSSPMVAVDDTNPNHIYIADAESTAEGNDDIIVRQSFNGGLTWPVPGTTVNSASPGRRFMPWVCSAGGSAFVSWYDRRAAFSSANDLTDYFLGSSSGGSTPIVSEQKLTGAPDPQCASGWAFGSDADSDSTSCSTQPQVAGHCFLNTIVGFDLTPISPPTCDISTGPCPSFTHCGHFGAIFGPKYGDYNGNACAAGRVYTAWASATLPNGAPLGFISTFSNVFVSPTQLTVKKTLIPANDVGRFDLRIDKTTVASKVGDGGSSGPQPVPPGNHQVSERAANGVSLSDYLTSFGQDCDSAGNVTVPIGANKVCTILNLTKVQACLDACLFHALACLAERGASCTSDYEQCVTACPAPPVPSFLTVLLNVGPLGDPGRFDLLVDDTAYARNVGNGGTTDRVVVSASPAVHTVKVTADVNTNLDNYAPVFTGDCMPIPPAPPNPPQATVALNPYAEGFCLITMTNKGPVGQLTINLAPSTDTTSRFGISVDGITLATGLKNGDSMGPLNVRPSPPDHEVRESVFGDYIDYMVSFGGACRQVGDGGTVTVPAGGSPVVCTITNTLLPPPPSGGTCWEGCEAILNDCTAHGTDPKQCLRRYQACLKRCKGARP